MLPWAAISGVSTSLSQISALNPKPFIRSAQGQIKQRTWIRCFILDVRLPTSAQLLHMGTSFRHRMSAALSVLWVSFIMSQCHDPCMCLFFPHSSSPSRPCLPSHTIHKLLPPTVRRHARQTSRRHPSARRHSSPNVPARWNLKRISLLL